MYEKPNAGISKETADVPEIISVSCGMSQTLAFVFFASGLHEHIELHLQTLHFLCLGLILTYFM